MRERIVCECGATLPRPVPSVCPHCGCIITAVRRSLWSRVWPSLAIAGLFALLLAYVWWLQSRV